jgi:valyl-tRNA synthetase
MSHELPKAYDPSTIETRWAEYWVKEKLFTTEASSNGDADQPVFTLLLPPPNVTGRLHMGHMLNQTEMDIIVRWHRMRGFLTQWLPGTDHAGIATQMMVERRLAAEGKKRRDMTRAQFLDYVWEWKKEFGGAILEQMRRLGASVDWSREYFTMDDHLCKAVREAFVRLHEEGLIYRGSYIVNWCPRCGTAVSDLEVAHSEQKGHLWEISYPVEGLDESITVATTRPETMLGDTAVAINEKDERYKHLHGRFVILPLVGRRIPIICDELAQPEFGTGAVKVTPAHDPNDYECGLRHKLPQINIMDESAHMNAEAGVYAGLSREAARERIVNELREQGYLVDIKDHTHAVGHCDRCKTTIEPRLSTQWFIAVNKTPKHGGPSMAAAAIEAVKSGAINFAPENYKTIYLNWMENIHDWCISRQLWWGHQIPAWHCADCQEITIARETPATCSHCGSANLTQDTDVLDTWFSSGLLPFSAMGWPEATVDLKRFYPTSLLITGFDILFFWVARMIMMGTHFMNAPHRPTPVEGDALAGSVPFRDVYIHSLVRDADRQKMSKTKGNVVDPIGVIEQYGTDAVRFTLAAMAAPGTDIAFSESRTESYRAFANKIWNAARFIFMNVDRAQAEGLWSLDEFIQSHLECETLHALEDTSEKGIDAFHAVTLEDRWILSRANKVAAEVHAALGEYRFHEAAHVIYHFFWGEFCDWYIELVKPRLLAGGEESKAAFANVVALFEYALRLLSPFMPFLTEEIWHAIYDGKPPKRSIALASYPQADAAQCDDGAETEMAILQDLIVAVRNIRAEIKVEPKQKLKIEVFAAAEIQSLLQANYAAIERQANVESLRFVEASLAQASNARSTARFEVRVDFERQVDVAAETERLTREIAQLEKYIAVADKQLGNESFLRKAPAKVVEGLQKQLTENRALLEKAQAALKALEK